MNHTLDFFFIFKYSMGSGETSGQTHKGKMKQDRGEGDRVLIREDSKKTD